jgi:hypothetical protein
MSSPFTILLLCTRFNLSGLYHRIPKLVQPENPHNAAFSKQCLKLIMKGQIQKSRLEISV